MSRRSPPSHKRRKSSKKRARALARILPAKPAARRLWRRFRSAPLPAQVFGALAICAIVSLAANWIYQVARKPSELFFPVSGVLNKTPPQTWREYSGLFKKYSTSTITPEFLAAIAQVEASGNPIVRTYWRWSWGSSPFEIYRPASSAVGMYQITDGTFAEARHFCIHGHAVVEEGPWNDWHSCWFTSLYARVIPADAVELTSADLDRHVAAILRRHRLTGTSTAQKLNLAALIHLCGAGAGDEYARRGLRLLDGQRCGDHLASAYLDRVATLQQEFARLRIPTSG